MRKGKKIRTKKEEKIEETIDFEPNRDFEGMLKEKEILRLEQRMNFYYTYAKQRERERDERDIVARMMRTDDKRWLCSRNEHLKFHRV